MKHLVFVTLLIFSLKLKAVTFPTNFVFGVANAPGQVEDDLDGIWLEWGQKGKVHSWKVTPHPEKRLEFWTKPEIEINLNV